MTTILASQKHKLMVADSLTTGGVNFKSRKIFRVNDKLVGFAGAVTHALKFIQWLEHGTPLNLHYDKNDFTFEALVLSEQALFYYDNELVPIEVSEQICAIGSGAPYALGALDAGASPKKAVEIAANRDECSGPPVIVMKL